MKEHGIIMSQPMVMALLAGRKSVTRRMAAQWDKVKAGDRLWVRETWGLGGSGRLIDPTINYRAGGQLPLNKISGTDSVWQHAYTSHCVLGESLLKVRTGWIPSIHMFRWASRILLECEEDTRTERLQHISHEDAQREGMESCTPYDQFRALWGTLHTKPGERWEDNPIVRRIGPFRRIQ